MTFAQDTFTVFYQEKPYFTGNKVKVLTPKFRAFDKKSALYIVAIYQKVLASFTWGINCDENMIKDFKITLPTHKNAQIAFDFMESYIRELEAERIRELEAERIRELEAYLFVAGLNDTTLTDTEIAALNAFEALTLHLTPPQTPPARGGAFMVNPKDSHFKDEHLVRGESYKSPSLAEATPFASPSLAEGDLGGGLESTLCQNDKNSPHNKNAFKKLTWQEFKIGDLFRLKSNPQLNKDSFKFSENGEYPYFTRTVLNNGIAGYVDYLDDEHKIDGNSIAVGMLGMQFFYMQKPFYAGQFTKTAFAKFENLNAKIAQFFIVWLNKKQKEYQGVLVRDFERLFYETKITLPTYEKDGKAQIAFDFIEHFIKAIEKQAISQVALYTSQKLNIAKDIVARG